MKGLPFFNNTLIHILMTKTRQAMEKKDERMTSPLRKTAGSNRT